MSNNKIIFIINNKYYINDNKLSHKRIINNLKKFKTLLYFNNIINDPKTYIIKPYEYNNINNNSEYFIDMDKNTLSVNNNGFIYKCNMYDVSWYDKLCNSFDNLDIFFHKYINNL